MSVYVAVHVAAAAGARVVTGQVTVPTVTSVTTTELSVTFPVLVTTNVYATVSPLRKPVGAPACLSSVIDGAAAIATSAEPGAVTGVGSG